MQTEPNVWLVVLLLEHLLMIAVALKWNEYSPQHLFHRVSPSLEMS
jgi:hypothetical protein